MSFIAPNPPWAGYTPPANTYVLLNPTNISERYEFPKPPQFPWSPKYLNGLKEAESMNGVLWQYKKSNNIIFPIHCRAFPIDYTITSVKNNIYFDLLPLLDKKIVMIFVNPGPILTGYYYVVETTEEFVLDSLPGEDKCDFDLNLRTIER